MSKRKDERQVKIRNILLKENRIKISELAKLLDITPETLRNDLNELEDQNIVIREHGYARLDNSLSELPVYLRWQENQKDKKMIVYRAFQELEDGQVVYLDSGSTILLGIPYISMKKDLTIISNSLPLALECAKMNLNIIFAGGSVLNEGLRCYGHFAEEIINHMHIDVAILGTDGILGSNGFTTNTIHEIGFKRHIINQSKKIITVCDQSKFEKEAPFKYCSFNETDLLITNQITNEQYQRVKDIKNIIQVKEA
ncbi:DeoR/GlpR family DNA-binding transcription regulator [Floccifex sp.]|uniref:DeoR/GlpR family DNA-binding transcription regulator n=1 Tax=Floccifex sp. TaxID=2815810 RepID=UPI003F09D2ED